MSERQIPKPEACEPRLNFVRWIPGYVLGRRGLRVSRQKPDWTVVTGHQVVVFNQITFAQSRLHHRIYLIQDNASYHKKQETHDWFQANRRYVKVFQLPPYWPELNATERIWHYTRKHVTHNRFFERPQDLCRALFHRFDYVRHHPQEIEGLLHPFFVSSMSNYLCAAI
jgi:transposase